MEFKNEDRCVPIHYSDIIAERFVPSAVPFRGLWACGEVVKEGSIVKVTFGCGAWQIIRKGEIFR